MQLPVIKLIPDPPRRVKITVTLGCECVLIYMDEINEKYPFYCLKCDEDSKDGKYPWKLKTEVMSANYTDRDGKMPWES